MRERQLLLFLEATRALVDRERGEIDRRSTPISPDISLPWSGECGPDGWSAKMFLHQMLSILRPRWTYSDTERLLSGRTPLRIQVNGGSGSSLSAVLRKPGEVESWTFVSDNALRGLIRRGLRRNRPFHVLLRTQSDLAMVTVTCTKDRCEFSILSSGQDLPDSPIAGLQDLVTTQWRALQGTP